MPIYPRLVTSLLNDVEELTSTSERVGMQIMALFLIEKESVPYGV